MFVTLFDMARRTIQERIDVLQLFYALNKTPEETARLYNAQHEGRIPMRGNTLRMLIKRFEQTGSVHDRKRPGRPPTKTDEVTAYEVLNATRRSPKKSIRRLAQQCSTSSASVHRILKANKFKSYIERHVQILRSNDTNRRYEFVSYFLDHIDVHTVLFSDEAIFQLNGRFHKARYWATENPRRYLPCRAQYSPKVMVWAGILGNRIIGPYFFDRNVTGMFNCCYISLFLRWFICNNVERFSHAYPSIAARWL